MFFLLNMFYVCLCYWFLSTSDPLFVCFWFYFAVFIVVCLNVNCWCWFWFSFVWFALVFVVGLSSSPSWSDCLWPPHFWLLLSSFSPPLPLASSCSRYTSMALFSTSPTLPLSLVFSIPFFSLSCLLPLASWLSCPFYFVLSRLFDSSFCSFVSLLFNALYSCASTVDPFLEVSCFRASSTPLLLVLLVMLYLIVLSVAVCWLPCDFPLDTLCLLPSLSRSHSCLSPRPHSSLVVVVCFRFSLLVDPSSSPLSSSPCLSMTPFDCFWTYPPSCSLSVLFRSLLFLLAFY